MYAVKLNEIKTDEGQIVRPCGYPLSFWPEGTEYAEAYAGEIDFFKHYGTLCYYTRLVGNVLEMYNCFDTEAQAQAFQDRMQYLSSILLASPANSDNDPADLSDLDKKAVKYSRLRLKTVNENFGRYLNTFEPNIINMADVDLTGFTRYECEY